MADGLDSLLKMKSFYEDAKKNIYKKFNIGAMQCHNNRVHHETTEKKFRRKCNSMYKTPDTPCLDGGLCSHHIIKDKGEEGDVENKDESGHINEGTESVNQNQEDSVRKNNLPSFVSECSSINWNDSEFKKLSNKASKQELVIKETELNLDKNITKNQSTSKSENINQIVEFTGQISRPLKTAGKVTENERKESGSKLRVGSVQKESNKDNKKRLATTQSLGATKGKKKKISKTPPKCVTDSCLFSENLRDKQKQKGNSSVDCPIQDSREDDSLRWIYPPRINSKNRMSDHKRTNVGFSQHNQLTKFFNKRTKQFYAMLDIRTTIDPFYFTPITSKSLNRSDRNFYFNQKRLVEAGSSNLRAKRFKPVSSPANLMKSHSVNDRSEQLNNPKALTVKGKLGVRAQQSKNKAKIPSNKGRY